MSEKPTYQSLGNASMVILAAGYGAEFGDYSAPNFLYMMAAFGFFGYYAQNYAGKAHREPVERGIGLLNLMSLLLISAAYIFHMEHWPMAPWLLMVGLGMMIIVWGFKLIYQKYHTFLSVITPVFTILMVASYAVKMLHLPFGKLAYSIVFPAFFILHGIRYFFPEKELPENEWDTNGPE